MRYMISDTHFGHARIIELSKRPFRNFEHMDQMLIENWNSIVGEDDTIFHLGDVALGSWDRWDSILTRLNGYKILVVGNHDRVFKGGQRRQQERFAPLYEGWFDEVHDSYELTLEDGTEVNLSHFPYDGDSHDEDRYSESRLKDEGKVLVHGHTHLDNVISRSKKNTIQIHVGVDAHNYTPVSEQQVIDYIRVAGDIT